MRVTKELREGEHAENALHLLRSFIHQRTGRVARWTEKYFTPSTAMEFIENLTDWQFWVAIQFAKPILLLLAEYACGGRETALAYLNPRMMRIQSIGHVHR